MTEKSVPAWGSRLGWLTPCKASPESSTDPTLNRLLVVETLYRYCTAYDERDREALADCFTDDTVFEASIAGTSAIGPIAGRSVFLDWLTAHWDEQHDQRRHIVLNPLVEQLAGASAEVSTIMLLTATENGVFRTMTAGFYHATLRKENGVWRMATLRAGFDAPY